MPAPLPYTVLSRASGLASAVPINSIAAREVKVSTGSNIEHTDALRATPSVDLVKRVNYTLSKLGLV